MGLRIFLRCPHKVSKKI